MSAHRVPLGAGDSHYMELDALEDDDSATDVSDDGDEELMGPEQVLEAMKRREQEEERPRVVQYDELKDLFGGEDAATGAPAGTQEGPVDSDEEDAGAEEAEIEREAREAMSQADSRRRRRPRAGEGADVAGGDDDMEGLSKAERLERFRQMRRGVRDRGPEFLPDPFYDPALDGEDERAAMKRYRVNPAEGMPHSDAVLHCPGCFGVVCIECQRHDKFENQYRAKKTVNCTAQGGAVRFDDQGRETSDGSGDAFQPVVCAACGARVGVLDGEGWTHLFHVVPMDA